MVEIAKIPYSRLLRVMDLYGTAKGHFITVVYVLPGASNKLGE